jgi:hypothetical protein
VPQLDGRVILVGGSAAQWVKHTKIFSDFAIAAVIRAALDDIGGQALTRG